MERVLRAVKNQWKSLCLMWLAYFLFNLLDFGDKSHHNIFQRESARIFYYAFVYLLVKESCAVEFIFPRVQRYKTYLLFMAKNTLTQLLPKVFMLALGFVLLSYPLQIPFDWKTAAYFLLSFLFLSFWIALYLAISDLAEKPMLWSYLLWIGIILSALLPKGFQNLFSWPTLDVFTLMAKQGYAITFLLSALFYSLLLGLFYFLIRKTSVNGLSLPRLKMCLKNILIKAKTSLTQGGLGHKFLFLAFLIFVFFSVEAKVNSAQLTQEAIGLNTTTPLASQQTQVQNYLNLFLMNTAKFSSLGLSSFSLFQIMYYVLFLSFLLLPLFSSIKEQNSFNPFEYFRYESRQHFLLANIRQVLKSAVQSVLKFYGIFIAVLTLFLLLRQHEIGPNKLLGVFIFLLLYIVRMFLFYLHLSFVLITFQISRHSNIGFYYLGTLPILLLIITSTLPEFSLITYSEHYPSILCAIGILSLALLLNLFILKWHYQEADLGA